MKKKPSKRAKVIKLSPRRQKAEALVRFSDAAHGGHLGAFRGYGANRATLTPQPP